MKFNLFPNLIYFGHDAKIRVRETLRFMSIGLALRELGHEIACANDPIVDVGIRRGRIESGVEVHPNVPSANHKRIILGNRTKVRNCLFNVEVDGDIPVPFGASGHVLKLLLEEGLFRDYSTGNVWPIRERFGSEDKSGGGFIGCGGYGREEKCQGLDGEFTFNSPIPADEYLRKIGKWDWGLALAGDRPQSYRFCELAMMGCHVVRDSDEWNLSPKVDDTNSSMIGELHIERTQKATEDYVNHWCPLGVARSIVSRLEMINGT